MITGGAVETTTSASLTQVPPTYLYAGVAADHAYTDDAHQIDRRVLLRPPNDGMRVPATYPSSERSTYTSAFMPMAQSDRNLSEYLVPGQMNHNRVVPPCLPRQYPLPSSQNLNTARGHDALCSETVRWNPPSPP
ncbi:hypothetical protein QAD02_008121 [Eretmocerus hayati]|uniref:Uncharacterized protein n=1 Tax=Eretmocerus hayati TaxID=131215 RepID=A0ACC2N5L3_9HYME|nr:hypothetical protein QAD02_008121 [Eretmocerus hayati]